MSRGKPKEREDMGNDRYYTDIGLILTDPPKWDIRVRIWFRQAKYSINM